jgi:hypothetical protein
MTQYIFRLATLVDKPAIQRLQKQFVAEMNDPLGIIESDFARSEFMLVEAVDESSKRAVGMMSIMHASRDPFVFERVFPDVWQRMDVSALTGRTGLQREDLVEMDWGYVEKPYRGHQLALLMFAGCLLHAHRQGYPVSVGIANAAAMARMPGGVFRGAGLVSEIGGVPYELGTLRPEQSAPLMADIVHSASARDRLLAWHVDLS